MITVKDLKVVAKARLKDAHILYSYKRYDAATYLCGYSVELALKAKICNTLNWKGFPENNREFQNRQSLKTHDLDTLLMFFGIEDKIKNHFLAEWSVVSSWKPENRYKPVGSESKSGTEDMINAVTVLLQVIK